MGLVEALAVQPALKMAYTQKKAESVVTGLEKPINDKLLMVWTMPESEHRPHWLNELANWIDLKPKNSRPTADFYYRILFDEPFGDAELANVMSRVKRLQRQGYVFTTPMSPADLVERLRQFHVSFGRSCADAPVPEDALRNMIGHRPEEIRNKVCLFTLAYLGIRMRTLDFQTQYPASIAFAIIHLKSSHAE